MSLQLGGVEEVIRLRVDPREAVDVADAVDRVVALLAVELAVVEADADAAFRAF
jgi:hypothetical protein